MKLSLVLMVWNTAHLLARTLQTLRKQTLDDWELIIVDDNSEDNVPLTLEQHGAGLPIQYHRLEHDFGMRGNTFSINYGVEQARGHVVMWSTPEVMLPPCALEAAHSTHTAQPEGLLWVTIPSHGLTLGLQLRIDEVDWKSDVHNIKHLLDGTTPDNWPSMWFHLNFYEHGRCDGKKKANYGNNQTVAVVRQKWLDTVGSFPLFMDYGSDDPWIARERKRHGYRDLTLWDQEAYHQWHPLCQYWMAQDKAPNWNRLAHTTSNLANDPRVPGGGTCEIWDKGDRSPLAGVERERALMIREAVIATGFVPRA